MKPRRVFYNTLPDYLRKIITQHRIKNSLDSCRIRIELNQKINRLLENHLARRDGPYYDSLTRELAKIRELEEYIQNRYRGTTDYVILNLPRGSGSRYSPYSDQTGGARQTAIMSCQSINKQLDQTGGARQTAITSCQSIDKQLDQIEETICRERVRLSLIFAQLEETDRRASEILSRSIMM